MNRAFYRQKKRFSQSYPMGRIVRNAQRTQKISFFLRKNRAYAIWRTQPFSVVLQIFGGTPLPSAFGSVARLRLPGIPSGRHLFGSSVFHCGRHRSCREHPVLDPQWADPTAVGDERFPPSGHVENFSFAFWSKGTGETSSSA